MLKKLKEFLFGKRIKTKFKPSVNYTTPIEPVKRELWTGDVNMIKVPTLTDKLKKLTKDQKDMFKNIVANSDEKLDVDDVIKVIMKIRKKLRNPRWKDPRITKYKTLKNRLESLKLIK